MTFAQLPSTPAAWSGAAWSDVEPFYAGLLAAPLEDSVLEEWLAHWSELESLLTEAASRAMIAHTLDTANAEKEAAHLRFSTEIMPRAEEQSVKVARRLLATGLSRPGLETTLRRFRTDSDIFRDESARDAGWRVVVLTQADFVPLAPGLEPTAVTRVRAALTARGWIPAERRRPK